MNVTDTQPADGRTGIAWQKMIILNHEIVNYAFKYVDNLFIFLLV